MISIPTSDDPFYTQTTSLDGKDYQLTFTYNQREKITYLSIATIESINLAVGIKLVCNWSLLLGRVDGRLPGGTLMILSNTLDASPPKLGELGEGKRCQLFYRSAT